MAIWDDYVPTPQWADNRPVIVGGAPPTSTEFRVTQEDVYDRLEYLRELTHPESGIVRELDPIAVNDARWRLSLSTSFLGGWLDHDPEAGVQSVLDFKVNIPHGAIVTAMRALIWPNAHDTQPTLLPKLELWKHVPGAESVLVNSVTHGAIGSLPTYEALHFFEKTGMLHATSKSGEQWFVRFLSEANGTFTGSADFLLCSVRVTFAIAQLDPGGN